MGSVAFVTDRRNRIWGGNFGKEVETIIFSFFFLEANLFSFLDFYKKNLLN